MVGSRIMDNIKLRVDTVKETVRLFKDSSVADAISHQAITFGINNRKLIRSITSGVTSNIGGRGLIRDEFSGIF